MKPVRSIARAIAFVIAFAIALAACAKSPPPLSEAEVGQRLGAAHIAMQRGQLALAVADYEEVLARPPELLPERAAAIHGESTHGRDPGPSD